MEMSEAAVTKSASSNCAAANEETPLKALKPYQNVAILEDNDGIFGSSNSNHNHKMQLVVISSIFSLVFLVTAIHRMTSPREMQVPLLRQVLTPVSKNSLFLCSTRFSSLVAFHFSHHDPPPYNHSKCPTRAGRQPGHPKKQPKDPSTAAKTPPREWDARAGSATTSDSTANPHPPTGAPSLDHSTGWGSLPKKPTSSTALPALTSTV